MTTTRMRPGQAQPVLHARYFQSGELCPRFTTDAASVSRSCTHASNAVSVAVSSPRRLRAALRHPRFHRLHQHGAGRAVVHEQLHVGLLCVVETIQAEVGFGPVLDRLGKRRRELQRAFVALERAVVVAQLSV